MSVTVLRKARTNSPEIMSPQIESADLVKFAACGSLICAGLLLLTGRKRTGLIAAAAGTALAMIEHEDSLRAGWKALPDYVGRAHSLLDHVQDVVDKVSEKGQQLRRTLGR